MSLSERVMISDVLEFRETKTYRFREGDASPLLSDDEVRSIYSLCRKNTLDDDTLDHQFSPPDFNELEQVGFREVPFHNHGEYDPHVLDLITYRDGSHMIVGVFEEERNEEEGRKISHSVRVEFDRKAEFYGTRYSDSLWDAGERSTERQISNGRYSGDSFVDQRSLVARD